MVLRGKSLLAFILAVSICTHAASQNAAVTGETSAQIRDVLFDATTGALYAALYARNEVARLDPQTGEIEATATVGSGPAGLAVSLDGALLAVVNRLGESISLVRTDTFEAIAETETGAGPVAITALPRGGFAVANSFDDSVTLVAPDGSITDTVTLPAAVPVAIAAEGDLLAVATREPAAVVVYTRGVGTPTTFGLADAPTALAALGGGRFAAGTRSEVVVINGRDGSVVAEAPIAVVDFVVVADGELLVLSEGGRVVRTDSTLVVREEISTPETARAVAAAPGYVIVAAPAARAVFFHGAPPAAQVAAPQPPEVVPPVSPPVETAARKPEVAPERAPEREPAPERPPRRGPVVVEAEPVPTRAEPEPSSPGPAPEPTKVDAIPAEAAPLAEAEREVGALPEEAGQLPEEQLAPSRSRSQYRPTPFPLGGQEPYAPPLTPPRYETFSEALSEGVAVDEGERGFTLPDWSDLLRDIEFGEVEGVPEEELQFRGGVELTLGETQLTANEFYQNVAGGVAEATGNVVVQQAGSTLTADRIKYQLPPEEESAEPLLILPEETEEERERRRTQSGIIEGENIHLVEPTRELEAEYLQYNLATGEGVVRNARGRAGVIYFAADELRLLGPDNYEAEDAWVTTCDRPVPHYRLRLRNAEIHEGELVLSKNARLQLWGADTPLFVPAWRSGSEGTTGRTSLDFDSGREADLGYFINLGIWRSLTPNIDAAIRFLPSEDEGLGVGIDLDYDFRDDPASRFFRSTGSFQTLYTTTERGYTHWYHRSELSERTVVLSQFEQWYDEDFFKDFFFDEFRDRTEPRTFANVTHVGRNYIATATTALDTHDWTQQTERLPEATYHLPERRFAENLYLTFDTYNGYFNRTNFRDDTPALRTVNVARLTYDWSPTEWLNIAPFGEADVAWYSNTLNDEDSEGRLSGVAGVTLQSRLARNYGARRGFSGFRHMIVPSLTYSYRPESGLDIDDTPQFDGLDSVPGRSRVEAKVDNVLFGRDAESGESWQVARISLYAGADLSNEGLDAQDYEVEMDIRPRPWWGVQAAAETHNIENRDDFIGRFLAVEGVRRARDFIRERVLDEEVRDTRDADFDRFLIYTYYDDLLVRGRFNGRVGFALTQSADEVFNREVLYGAGYRINDNWSVAFEQRYDFERDELSRQSYEVRRRLHEWEATFQFRDRPSGFDINFALSLSGFPATQFKF